MNIGARAGSEIYIAIEGENDLKSRGFNQALLTIEEALALLEGTELRLAIMTCLKMQEPQVKLHKKNMALAKKLGVKFK